MRRVCVALAMLTLAACNRGLETKEAVRQGVLDHLKERKMNWQDMTIDVASVKFNGSQADAVVSFSPKGAPAGSGMTLPYKLEQRDGKWVVTGTTAHPGATMPEGTANPHGGTMPPATGGGHPDMPSPNDLPPVKQK